MQKLNVALCHLVFSQAELFSITLHSCYQSQLHNVTVRIWSGGGTSDGVRMQDHDHLIRDGRPAAAAAVVCMARSAVALFTAMSLSVGPCMAPEADWHALFCLGQTVASAGEMKLWWGNNFERLHHSLSHPRSRSIYRLPRCTIYTRARLGAID